MAEYRMPTITRPAKVGAKQVLLIANGDLRRLANRNCWAAQHALEDELARAFEACGSELVRAHPYKEDEGHGFISSQKEGLEVFGGIDPKARLVVAEAVWQYSHHVLGGLMAHQGPILLAANWSGEWPGLVGMLNLAASLTKAGVKYSSLWSEEFMTDRSFLKDLKKWLTTGKVTHPMKHVTPLAKVKIPPKERKLGRALAGELMTKKAIMGVFDEGCMGMFNAIIPDHLLNPTGVYKERLSQSSLYYATTQVSDDEARGVYEWLLGRGMKFDLGTNEETDLN